MKSYTLITLTLIILLVTFPYSYSLSTHRHETDLISLKIKDSLSRINTEIKSRVDAEKKKMRSLLESKKEMENKIKKDDEDMKIRMKREMDILNSRLVMGEGLTGMGERKGMALMEIGGLTPSINPIINNEINQEESFLNDFRSDLTKRSNIINNFILKGDALSPPPSSVLDLNHRHNIHSSSFIEIGPPSPLQHIPESSIIQTKNNDNYLVDNFHSTISTWKKRFNHNLEKAEENLSSGLDALEAIHPHFKSSLIQSSYIPHRQFIHPRQFSSPSATIDFKTQQALQREKRIQSELNDSFHSQLEKLRKDNGEGLAEAEANLEKSKAEEIYYNEKVEKDKVDHLKRLMEEDKTSSFLQGGDSYRPIPFNYKVESSHLSSLSSKWNREAQALMNGPTETEKEDRDSILSPFQEWIDKSRLAAEGAEEEIKKTSMVLDKDLLFLKKNQKLLGMSGGRMSLGSFLQLDDQGQGVGGFGGVELDDEGQGVGRVGDVVVAMKDGLEREEENFHKMLKNVEEKESSNES